MQLDFWRGGVVVSGTPSVGTPFTISFGVNPIETVPDANMRIFIPDGMVLLSGEDIQMGVTIPANSTYTQTITVKTLQSGTYELSGRIESATWSSFNRSYWKFVESTASGGDVDAPTPEPLLIITPIKVEDTVDDDNTDGVPPSTPLSCTRLFEKGCVHHESTFWWELKNELVYDVLYIPHKIYSWLFK
jgi:hypothetical protein